MNQQLLAKILAVLLSLRAATTQQADDLTALLDELTVASMNAVVAPTDDLQAAMDKAPAGATLQLQPGATYTGNFVCRGNVLLTTKLSTPLPVGYRVQPSDAPRLAQLRSPNNQPAWRTAPGSTGCLLAAVLVTSADPRGTALAIGTGVETAIEQLPSGSELHQVVVLGDPVNGLKRCVSLHGRNVAVSDSYIAGCRVMGEDSQAIWINSGPGPYRIVNNYLEAASENLLTGGDRVRIPDVVPSDITIDGNTFAKPAEWKALKGWNVKNLLEVKNGRRITIRGNTFDGTWPDAQAGYAILFTPKDQYGDNPWVTIEYVTFQDNVVRNVSSAINIYGAIGGIDSDGKPTQRLTGLLIRGNRLLVDKAKWGGDGRCWMVGGGPIDVTWEQNTCLSNGATAIYTYGPTSASVERATVRNNIWAHNTYGFSGALSGLAGKPLATLMTYYPGAIWSGNVVCGATSTQYPADTVTLTVAQCQAEFADYIAGMLKTGSVLTGKGAP